MLDQRTKTYTTIRSILASDMSAFDTLKHTNSNLFYIEQLKKNNKFNQKASDSLSKLNFLPIETFKQKPLDYFQGNSLHYEFYSSGTTSTRSRSLFSKPGLDLYEFESVFTFKSMLDSFYGSSSLKIKGYSLIPPLKSMPTSSLSWMLDVLSKYWDVENISVDDFIYKIDHSKKFWLFTTTVQLVDIFDKLKEAGIKLHLSSDIALIQTGGNKGIRREEFSPSKIHSYCKEYLSVPSDNIIDEYSMSELSSQAYSWVSYNNRMSNQTKKTTTPLKHRYLRFPSWVQLSVDQNQSDSSPNQGPLIINDPYRVDFNYPIRTQDICELIPDKNSSYYKFRFISRVPSSVLKGCSLNISPLIRDPFSNITIDDSKKLNISIPDMKKRAALCNSFLQLYLNSQSTKTLYSKHFDSSHGASLILSSILKSISIYPDLFKASLTSLGIDPESKIDSDSGSNSIFLDLPSSVLMLFSSTNQMALIYPVIMAYICGFQISCKLSTRSTNELSLDFLNSFNSYLSLHGFSDNKIKIYDSSSFYKTRIQTGFIFVHGSDETINILTRQFPSYVQGFGSSLAFNIDTSLDPLPSMIQDAFILGQQGCLSSRGIFIFNPNLKKEDILDLIPEDSSWLVPTSMYRYSIRNAEINLIQNGVFFKPRTNSTDPLYPIYELSSLSELGSSMLVKYPYVLPIFLVQENLDTCSFLKHISYIKSVFPELNLVLSSKSLIDSLDQTKIHKLSPFIQLRLHGYANIYPWDGTFQRRPLWSKLEKSRFNFNLTNTSKKLDDLVSNHTVRI